MKSLMNASFGSEEGQEAESELANGLASDHAYSVIQAVEVKIERGLRIRLIKLRNPWGSLKPWKGAWNVNSNKWKNLDEEIKKKYSLRLDKNGEFYMSFSDFTANFEELNVAHVNLNAFFSELGAPSSSEHKWQLKQYYDGWRHKVNSGTDDGLYWANAQYLIEIKDDGSLESDEASVVIALMQPYSVKLRYNNEGNYSYRSIKFHLYRVDADERRVNGAIANGKRLKKEYLTLLESTGGYAPQREVTKRSYLAPGHYVVLPSVLQEEANADYLVRIFYDRYSCSLIKKLTN